MRILTFIQLILTVTFYLLGTPAYGEPVIDLLEHNIEQKRHILVIHSYQENHQWTRDLNRGIETCLSDSGISTELYTIYLDSKRVVDKQMYQNRLKTALHSYQNIKFDLAIACDDNAFHSIVEIKHPSMDKLPILFCGVEQSDSIKEIKKRHPNITGIIQRFDFKNNLELGLSLFPTTKRVVVATDNTRYGKEAKLEALKQIGMHYHAIPIEYIDGSEGITSQQLIWMYETYPSDYLVIMPNWTTGYDNLYLEDSFLYPILSEICRAPILTADEIGLQTGALGGYTITAYEHAYEAAQLGAMILHGADIRNIPIDYKVKSSLFMDWEQMEHFNISIDNLPSKAIIINRESSFFESYRLEILSTILLFAFLILLLTSTLLYHLKYRKAIISERKLTHQNRTLANRYRIIFNNPFKGVFLYHVEGDRLIEVNAGLCNLLGYTQKELLAKHPSQISPTFTNTLQNIISHQEAKLETKLISKSGDLIPVTASSGYFKEDGNHYLYALYIDRTEIYAIQKDLADQKRELDITLQSLAEGVITINRDNQIVSINRMAANHLAINDNSNHYIGHDIKELICLINISDPNTLDHLIEQARINDQAVNFNKQTQISLHNDEHIHISGSISCIKDEQEIYGSVIVFKDITYEYLQHEELIMARNKAMQSDQLKSAFLANMSHEIRTPLNGIVGFANLLTSDDYSIEDKESFISIINSNCQILLSLISDILDLSRIESGSISFHTEECAVNELLETLVESIRININKPIQLILETPQEPAKSLIITDSVRLSQVITNLINNAVKFTEEGSITVGYRIEDNTTINFYVRDTGCGIAQEDLQNIFGRFFKKNEFIQGTGLGLSICTAIVEKFGGNITVVSEIGKGSEFIVSIPYLPIDDKLLDQAAAQDTNTATAATSDKSTYTILVAEDDQSNYKLIEAILAKQFKLIHAVNGIEAVAAFQKNIVDLILMDVKMPLMTGIEALIEIRKLSATIPIVMQTAYAFDADREIAKKAGCNDFITKPIQVSLLKSIINTQLGTHS